LKPAKLLQPTSNYFDQNLFHLEQGGSNSVKSREIMYWILFKDKL
jgi:hypothetical protein